MKPATLETLKHVCPDHAFAKGSEIRLKGAFARNMYFILKGEVEIDLAPDNPEMGKFSLGENTPVGEIGFINGTGANANVTATTDVQALKIDDTVLLELEKKYPESAIDFSRYLAQIVDRRLMQNQTLPTNLPDVNADEINIVRCIDKTDLQKAQQIRYGVYCTELGRTSPYANHEAQVICDDLDNNGITFLATYEDKPVGTARINMACESNLGILENLYGMNKSSHHPLSTCIVTKFAIINSHRRGGVYARLFGAITSYVQDSDIQELYMDGIPKVAKFYQKLGFEQCETEFIHYENGLSIPLVLNVKSKGVVKKIRRIFSLLRVIH